MEFSKTLETATNGKTFRTGDRVRVTHGTTYQGLQGVVIESGDMIARVVIDGSGTFRDFLFKHLEPIAPRERDNGFHIKTSPIKVANKTAKVTRRGRLIRNSKKYAAAWVDADGVQIGHITHSARHGYEICLYFHDLTGRLTRDSYGFESPYVNVSGFFSLDAAYRALTFIFRALDISPAPSAPVEVNEFEVVETFDVDAAPVYIVTGGLYGGLTLTGIRRYANGDVDGTLFDGEYVTVDADNLRLTNLEQSDAFDALDVERYP
jgi:hypothetical protein